MSTIITHEKRIILPESVALNIDIEIPINGNESNEAYHERSETIFPILDNQYVRGTNERIEDYKASLLPKKFLTAQEVLLTHLPENYLGAFNQVSDLIVMDPDAMCDILARIPASYIFGYLMGQKIAKYKATDEAYKELADLLDISPNYDRVLREIFAEECGNLVSPTIFEREALPAPLTKQKREGVQRLILSRSHK